MVLLNMSLPQLVLLPPLVLLAAGVALFNFQNLFRFLSVGGSRHSLARGPSVQGSNQQPHVVVLTAPAHSLLSLYATKRHPGLKDYMTIPIVQSLRPCAFD